MSRIGAFSGRKVNVSIGLEDQANPGVPVASQYTYPDMDISIKDVDTPLTNESGYGSIIQNNDKTTTLVEGAGTISGKIYLRGIYYFLALTFGQKPVTTDVVGDMTAKRHRFALRDDNAHISATIGVKTPIEDLRFPYAMPESFKITWTPGDHVLIEFPVKSRRSVTGTTIAAYVVDSKFLPKHARLYIADDIAALTAAPALDDIKSFTMEFTKNIVAEQTMPTGLETSEVTHSDIFNTDFNVTGSIEKRLRDTTYRGRVLNDEIKALRFVLSDSVNKAGVTTASSLKFDLARVSFDTRDASYGKSDISTETINFALLLNVANPAESIVAELVNKYTYA